MGFLAAHSYAESNSTRDDDLSRTIYLLNQLDDFQRQRFPFLRGRVGLNILLAIGHRQACGMPMTLTEILDADLTSISTVVRNLRQMEKHGVLIKRKASNDKRNVLYLVTPENLSKLRELFAHLADSIAQQLTPILEKSTDSSYRNARGAQNIEPSLNH